MKNRQFDMDDLANLISDIYSFLRRKITLLRFVNEYWVKILVCNYLIIYIKIVYPKHRK